LGILKDTFRQLLSTEINNKQELLNLSSFQTKFDGSNHPDVLSKKYQKIDIWNDFYSFFTKYKDISPRISQMMTVSKDDFIQYYSFLSPTVESDDYFELIIRSSWSISSSMTSMLCPLVTSNSESSIENKNNKTDLDCRSILKKILNQNKNKPELNVQLQAIPNSPVSPRQICVNGPNPPANITTVDNENSNQSQLLDLKTLSGIDPGIALIIKKLKHHIASKGPTGYLQVKRLLWSYDEDENDTLNFSEFKKAIRDKRLDLGLLLMEKDIKLVFEFFDKDGNSEIDVNEFMNVVRDPMPTSRLNQVNSVFNQLSQRIGSRNISMEDLMSNYNAQSHPEVIAGRLTADDIFKSFIEEFDIRTRTANDASKSDFIEYYTNISTYISSDQYFTILLCNTWNCSISTQSSGVVEKLRAKTQSSLPDNTKKIISALQQKAVSCYNKKKYREAKDIFVKIRNELAALGFDPSCSSPDYILNEKSIQACEKYLNHNINNNYSRSSEGRNIT
jgi:Ca2+-binding EF-hand superfamily protein